MQKQDWIYMDGYYKVVTVSTNDLVFSTKKLDCIKNGNEDMIDNIISIHNNNGIEDIMSIDDYLLDELNCSQEDREYIMEECYNNYYSKTILL